MLPHTVIIMVIQQIEDILSPTRIGSNAADIAGGTFVPHNFIRRRNDEYVCIGIMPGMMGTLMPEQFEHGM